MICDLFSINQPVGFNHSFSLKKIKKMLFKIGIVALSFAGLVNCDDDHPLITHKAWFDIAIDDEPEGRITFGLYG